MNPPVIGIRVVEFEGIEPVRRPDACWPKWMPR
jgi:hypothetical protein